MEAKEFDIKNFDFKNGVFLIEASAGTGKTYSIGLIALKRILYNVWYELKGENEKIIDVSSMLFMTFTNEAVDELRTRIFSFFRNAKDVIERSIVEDNIYKNIILPLKEAILKEFNLSDENDILKRFLKVLEYNIFRLNELEIKTIDSFSLRVLKDYKVEDRDSFNIISSKEKKLLEKEAINIFWRKRILNNPIIERFDVDDLNLINSIYKELSNYFQEVNQIYRLQRLVGSKDKSVIEVREELRDDYNRIFKELKDIDELFNRYKEYKNKIDEKDLNEMFKVRFFNLAFYEVKDSIFDIYNSLKRKRLLIEHDDYVYELIDLINKEYVSIDKRVVFVDEFQDTDIRQFFIIYKLFIENREDREVYFIGDPKQSIYEWRKADLNVYNYIKRFIADEIYTLTKSYRSTQKYVDDVNKIFKNIFTGLQDPYRIDYIDVQSAKKEEWENKNLLGDIKDGIYFKVIDRGNEYYDRIVNLIKFIKEKNSNLNFSDIAILVESNDDITKIEKILLENNIPLNLYQSQEYSNIINYINFILYLLYLLKEPTINNLKLFLYKSELVFHNKEKFLDISQDDLFKYLEIFVKGYKNYEENKKSLYAIINEIIKELNIRKIRTDYGENYSGIANIGILDQFLDTIAEWEVLYKMNIDEIIENLEKISKKDSFYGNLNKLESSENFKRVKYIDKDAVNIMTIHKSKGLAYKVVILFITSIYDKGREGYKLVTEKSIIKNKNDKKFDPKDFSYYLEYKKLKITEQEIFEKLRVLYVALTRAEHITFGFLTEKKKNNNKLSNIVVDEKSSLIDEIIEFKEEGKLEEKKEKKELKVEYFKKDELKLNHSYVSYSYLVSNKNVDDERLFEWIIEILSEEKEEKKIEYQNDYDRFIFEELPKSAKTGNFIHTLLEKIDLKNPEDKTEVIKQIGLIGKSEYPYIYNPSHLHFYYQLIKNVSNAVINELNGLKIKDILFYEKEIQFYYKINVSKDKLNKFFKKIGLTNDISIEYNIDGWVNGIIDMLFKEKGKYYILDWKTNFLGKSLEDYTTGRIEENIFKHSYNVQFFIYAIGLKRLLERIGEDFYKSFGGVIYAYIRGMRENSDLGFYVLKSEDIYPKSDKNDKKFIELIDEFDRLIL